MKTREVLRETEKISREAKKRLFSLNAEIAECHMDFGSLKHNGVPISRKELSEVIWSLRAQQNYCTGLIRGLEIASDLLHGNERTAENENKSLKIRPNE
jgi:hypothetical protein